MAADDRLKCFFLGTEVGDGLEDLQEQTEDLLEQAAMVGHGEGRPETIAVDSCIVNQAGEVYDMLVGPAADCGFNEAEVNLGFLSELRSGRVRVADVPEIRRKLDRVTMYFAAKANEVGLHGTDENPFRNLVEGVRDDRFPFRCNQCGDVFASMRDVIAHEAREHMSRAEFEERERLRDQGQYTGGQIP